MKRDLLEDLALIGPGLLLMVAAFVLPTFGMVWLSFFDNDGQLTLANYTRFLTDGFYLSVLWRTIWLAAVVTVICAVIGFVLAFVMARVGPRLRLWLVALTILPLMTNVVIRTFGWMVMFGRGGVVPDLLNGLGLVNRNFTLMHTETAVVIGLVQVLTPFATLSILGAILKIDRRLEEASRTMGANFGKTMRHVVLPLAMPGILAGSILTFTISASSFITPQLLGSVRLQVLAGSIYDSAMRTFEWNFAAAQAVILLVGVLLALLPYMRLVGARRGQ